MGDFFAGETPPRRRLSEESSGLPMFTDSVTAVLATVSERMSLGTLAEHLTHSNLPPHPPPSPGVNSAMSPRDVSGSPFFRKSASPRKSRQSEYASGSPRVSCVARSTAATDAHKWANYKEKCEEQPAPPTPPHKPVTAERQEEARAGLVKMSDTGANRLAKKTRGVLLHRERVKAFAVPGGGVKSDSRDPFTVSPQLRVKYEQWRKLVLPEHGESAGELLVLPEECIATTHKETWLPASTKEIHSRGVVSDRSVLGANAEPWSDDAHFLPQILDKAAKLPDFMTDEEYAKRGHHTAVSKQKTNEPREEKRDDRAPPRWNPY